MRRALEDLGPVRSLAARTAGTDRDLVLEVGCGYGEAALGFAAAHPDTDLLATDVHTPGIAHLLERAGEAAATNLYVERVDALDLLDEALPTGSLAGVHLFFPDPWPKTRHHKRRFVRDDVLDLLADRLQPGGALLVATDVDDYARRAVGLLDRHPAFHGGPGSRPPWRPPTRYEGEARRAGRSVVELRYERR
jgi:tRNA (guanine-N7-)-methyltransferase